MGWHVVLIIHVDTMFINEWSQPAACRNVRKAFWLCLEHGKRRMTRRWTIPRHPDQTPFENGMNWVVFGVSILSQ